MAKKKSTRAPLWHFGLGITQSALTDFMACREQFGARYIDGWTPKGLSIPLEFGTVIHHCIQRQITKGASSPEKIVAEVCAAYDKSRRGDLKGVAYDDFQRMLTMAEALFPIYAKHNAADDAKQKWIGRERVFSVEHTFSLGHSAPTQLYLNPGTAKVLLRGMRDGEYRIHDGTLGLFETKTKSSIDDVAIQAALRSDLQTMFYLLALQIEYGETPTEVLYNVIRRPQLRMSVKETFADFKKRIQQDIVNRLGFYFRRYQVTILPQDIAAFVRTTLDPALRLLLQWADSISADPFDRFQSPLHFRNLNALFNKYGKCQLYDLLVLGHEKGYYRRSSLFPELEESSTTKVA
jgi:hypothetical protein